ncbi:Bme15 [Brucella ceti M490/95/1]|nr:Bme15 [Brucella ceti M490/95/1]
MASEHWPDLPVGIKNGAAARIGNMAYVGLGSAGTDFYALDLNNPSKGWVKRANFIGPATNGAAMAAAGGKIFAFSGNGKATPDAKSPIIFDTAYVYDPGSDGWSKLDTQTPVGLSGAKAVGLADGRIAIFGGYNKELFDKYLADVGAIDKDKEPEAYRKLVDSYMGMKPEAYRWNDEVLVYDPAGNNWGSLGANPFLPNCDPAMATMGEGDFLLVSGEIKPGLRTPEAKLVKIRDGAAHWQKVSDLPPLSGSEPQEEWLAPMPERLAMMCLSLVERISRVHRPMLRLENGLRMTALRKAGVMMSMLLMARTGRWPASCRAVWPMAQPSMRRAVFWSWAVKIETARPARRFSSSNGMARPSRSKTDFAVERALPSIPFKPEAFFF